MAIFNLFYFDIPQTSALNPIFSDLTPATFFYLSIRIQPHKGAAVFSTQDAHQGGKTFAGVAADTGFGHHHRETDGMYPDTPGTVFCPFVDAIYNVDDRLNPIPAELITKNIQAYFLIGCIKCSDGSCD